MSLRTPHCQLISTTVSFDAKVPAISGETYLDLAAECHETKPCIIVQVPHGRRSRWHAREAANRVWLQQTQRLSISRRPGIHC